MTARRSSAQRGAVPGPALQGAALGAAGLAFAVIGSPLRHSLSPLLHTTSFRALGINGTYLAHEVTAERADAAVRALRELGYAGFNVTMPCKQAVMASLDELSPEAELMGAVNTVARRGERLIGFNTDGAGALRAIRAAGVELDAVEDILVLGSGGASSAIYTQAAMEAVPRVSVFARPGSKNWEATRRRIAMLNERTSARLELHRLDDPAHLAEAVAAAQVIINGTNVGMAPREEETVLDTDLLGPQHAVFDAVYNPLETRLLREAAAAGATTICGLEMLLWQAVLAEEIWLERSDIPVAAMREALSGARRAG